MTLSNQSHFPRFFSPREMTYRDLANSGLRQIAGHLLFNIGQNESCLTPQFEWLDNTFNCSNSESSFVHSSHCKKWISIEIFHYWPVMLLLALSGAVPFLTEHRHSWSMWMISTLNRPENRPPTRVGNFRQKNYSAKDGVDGTIGLFRRNSGCSAEQKTLGIPFQTIPRKRNQLGIPFRGAKKEAKSRNSVPKHVSDKNTLSILFAGAGFF
jgi:hypothetical protein